MDSDSEGDEVDLGENYCEDSDEESDWEPDQEDFDTQSEQEDEDFNSPRPSKNIMNFISKTFFTEYGTTGKFLWYVRKKLHGP